jgi:adenylate cyclase
MLAIKNRTILAYSLLIILTIVLSSLYASKAHRLSALNDVLLDSFFRLRGPLPASKDIVIVGIDRKSAVEMKRKSNGWKRTDFATMIRNLTAAGADLIAIDYIFVQRDTPEQDQALSSAMQESANVILASVISGNNRSFPLDMFRSQEVGEGFIDISPDEDRVVRWASSLSSRNEQGHTLIDLPFPIAIAMSRLYPQGNYKLENQHIPFSETNPRHSFLINFAGPPETFPPISAVDVIKNRFDQKLVHGKIVLIGNMDPLEHDYFPVPFQPDSSKMQSMYGIEIHANAIQTLLTKQFIVPMRSNLVIVLLLVVAFACFLLSFVWKQNSLITSAAAILLLLVFFFVCYSLFLKGTFVPAAPIFLSGILITATGIAARQAEEAADKRFITQLFGRYVAPNVVKELIEHRDLIVFAGRKERLTMFFSDIRGFTTMSERLAPEQVSTLLNEYFSHMTKIVFKHGGTLDKFMGDAVMAFFGNPIFFADHPKRAVQMALEMKKEMEVLCAKWKSEGKESEVGIGMGINTGEVVVGNLGSNEFFDYTVIGDAVNLACRLEAMAKKGQIIVSESTYQEVKDYFKIEKLEPVMVKGKTQLVQIYEVISEL